MLRLNIPFKLIKPNLCCLKISIKIDWTYVISWSWNTIEALAKPNGILVFPNPGFLLSKQFLSLWKLANLDLVVTRLHVSTNHGNTTPTNIEYFTVVKEINCPPSNKWYLVSSSATDPKIFYAILLNTYLDLGQSLKLSSHEIKYPSCFCYADLIPFTTANHRDEGRIILWIYSWDKEVQEGWSP